MDIQNAGVEPVSLSDILSLATWDRERSSEELQDFITRRHQALEGASDVEL